MDVNFIEGNRSEERDNIRPFSGIADGHYTIRTSIRMECNLTNSTVNYISRTIYVLGRKQRSENRV